jgi:DNA-binding CsgD family transcriptional regulator
MAQSQRGQACRHLFERALSNAFKEGQIAPFLESRDALLGLSSQIKSIPALRRRPVMLRFANKILKSVDQSYVIPETLHKIGFSRRQYRVVAALQGGATNKQIARQLRTTEATVKYHLTSVYRITSVTKRLELIEFMYKNRIFIEKDQQPEKNGSIILLKKEGMYAPPYSGVITGIGDGVEDSDYKIGTKIGAEIGTDIVTIFLTICLTMFLLCFYYFLHIFQKYTCVFST